MPLPRQHSAKQVAGKHRDGDTKRSRAALLVPPVESVARAPDETPARALLTA